MAIFFKSGNTINVQKKRKYKHKVLRAIKYNKSLKEITDAINSEPNINRPNKNGETPLFWAIRNHALEAIHLLLKLGANINFQNNQLETALFWAIRENLSIDIIAILISGTNVNHQNRCGDTPLSLAIKLNAPIQTIEALLNAEANVYLKNKDGYSPLRLAQKHYPSVINVLLKQDFKCMKNTLLLFYPRNILSEIENSEACTIINALLGSENDQDKPSF